MSGIVHLEQEIEQLTQERDAALARAVELEKERDNALQRLEDLEELHAFIVKHANIVCDGLTQSQADLQAARTAAELAAKHREQLEQLIRDYQRDDSKDLNSQCHCHLCKRATELLSEVKS